MKKDVRILLTGGGTGGHIYPLLAIADEIKNLTYKHNRPLSLFFLGSISDSYASLLYKHQIVTAKITPSKIRRYFSLANFFEPFKFAFGLCQAFWYLFWIMPDSIIAKGGPGSLPVALAGWFYRIPILLHESDSIPSLTTRLVSFFASSIAVSFPSSTKYFNSKKTVSLTGNPVRYDLLNNLDEQVISKRYFGFNPNKPVILVLGGSQGAEVINDFMIKLAPDLIKTYQILHQTGEKNFKEAKGSLRFIAESINQDYANIYKLFPYFDKDLKEAYNAADIIVARAGAATIFEIAAFGKPSILIPLPLSAGNHQRYNAYEFADSGASIVIEQSNLLDNVFLVQLNKIIENDNLKKKMGESAQEFYISTSASILAEESIRLAYK